MGEWVGFLQKEFVPLEPNVWIKTRAQLVVGRCGGPGNGEEALGKCSGSLKGSHDSRNTGIQPKEPGRNVIRKT